MMKSTMTSIANGPKYPHVKVRMTGADGGFYPTVAAVQTAMRRAGIPQQELSNFYGDAAEAAEGSLLRTCLEWVDVEVR